MKQIMCVRLCQWPIDRLQRSRQSRALRDAALTNAPFVNTPLSNTRLAGAGRGDSTGVDPGATPRPASFDLKKPNPRKNRKAKANELSSILPPPTAPSPAATSPYPFGVDHARPMRHDLWFNQDLQDQENCRLEKVSGCRTAAASPMSRVSPPEPACQPPLLIVRTVADRQVVVCLGPDARAMGIGAGMTLTQARALCAGVRHAEHQPLRDQRALEALARWLMRFSPVVAMACEAEEPAGKKRRQVKSGPARSASPSAGNASAAAPHAVYLDLTGCALVFGGLANLVRQMHEALTRLRIHARLAVGPTMGAAWALAEAGPDAVIVAPEQLAQALAPLPPAALRLGRDLVAALHHLGLSTVEQVSHLPRDVLPARFGNELLLRLDQAFGRIDEPLTPLPHHAPVQASMEFDGPVSSPDAIDAVGRRLLRQVIAQLVQRGCGARRLDVELSRAYAAPVKKCIPLSHPSRDQKSLLNLMRCALEEPGRPPGGPRRGFQPAARRSSVSIRPQASSAPQTPGHTELTHKSLNVYGNGYTAMHLSVPLLQRLTEEQIFLLEQAHHASRVQVDRLVDRLRLRLGEESAARVELVESHLPERAWKRLRETTEAFATPVPRREKSGVSAAIAPRAPLPRPLFLLPSPIEVRVIVTPSHAAEGRPAAFVHAREVHRVAHWAGPERLSGCWWDGHDKTRDYFEIEDATGKRFWIFRVCQTARWYLHGAYQ